MQTNHTLGEWQSLGEAAYLPVSQLSRTIWGFLAFHTKLELHRLISYLEIDLGGGHVYSGLQLAELMMVTKRRVLRSSNKGIYYFPIGVANAIDHIKCSVRGAETKLEAESLEKTLVAFKHPPPSSQLLYKLNPLENSFHVSGVNEIKLLEDENGVQSFTLQSKATQRVYQLVINFDVQADERVNPCSVLESIDSGFISMDGNNIFEFDDYFVLQTLNNVSFGLESTSRPTLYYNFEPFHSYDFERREQNEDHVITCVLKFNASKMPASCTVRSWLVFR